MARIPAAPEPQPAASLRWGGPRWGAASGSSLRRAGRTHAAGLPSLGFRIEGARTLRASPSAHQSASIWPGILRQGLPTCQLSPRERGGRAGRPCAPLRWAHRQASLCRLALGASPGRRHAYGTFAGRQPAHQRPTDKPRWSQCRSPQGQIGPQPARDTPGTSSQSAGSPPPGRQHTGTSPHGAPHTPRQAQTSRILAALEQQRPPTTVACWPWQARVQACTYSAGPAAQAR